MTAPAAVPTFTVHTLDRDFVWRVVVNRPDGTVTDAAVVRWLIDLVRPNAARERLARGLNGQVSRQPGRTWGWQPVRGTYRAELLHNGRVVGEVDWVASVRAKADRMTAMIDALNEERGRDDLCPEPAPRRPRHVEPIPGDFDFSTGKEIVAA